MIYWQKQKYEKYIANFFLKNFQEGQIIFNKFLRKNYTLYLNYKIIIYSHPLRGFATI